MVEHIITHVPDSRKSGKPGSECSVSQLFVCLSTSAVSAAAIARGDDWVLRGTKARHFWASPLEQMRFAT